MIKREDIIMDINGITESINILSDRMEKPGINIEVCQRDIKKLQAKRRVLKSIIE